MIITALCVSDTHGHMDHLHSVGKMPDADILLHAGDMSVWDPHPRYQEELYSDLLFLRENHQRFKHIIFTPGNHDESIMNNDPVAMTVINSIPNLHILVDKQIVIEELDDLRIYGSPWVHLYPQSYAKCYSLPYDSKILKEKREGIPEDIDILLTHTPPWHVLDMVGGKHVGCEHLEKRLETVRPALHVCGHIHSANGTHFHNRTTTINAAICNMSLEPHYDPFFVEFYNKRVVEAKHVK